MSYLQPGPLTPCLSAAVVHMFKTKKKKIERKITKQKKKKKIERNNFKTNKKSVK